MIINDPGYDRAIFALGMALAQRALGFEVRLLFTYGAIIRLKRGRTDELGEETNQWVIGEIRSGLQAGAVSRASGLLSDLNELGGKIYACPAAMSLHGIVSEDLVDEVDAVRGLVSFLTEEQGAPARIVYI